MPLREEATLVVLALAVDDRDVSMPRTWILPTNGDRIGSSLSSSSMTASQAPTSAESARGAAVCRQDHESPRFRHRGTSPRASTAVHGWRQPLATIAYQPRYLLAAVVTIARSVDGPCEGRPSEWAVRSAVRMYSTRSACFTAYPPRTAGHPRTASPTLVSTLGYALSASSGRRVTGRPPEERGSVRMSIPALPRTR